MRLTPRGCYKRKLGLKMETKRAPVELKLDMTYCKDVLPNKIRAIRTTHTYMANTRLRARFK